MGKERNMALTATEIANSAAHLANHLSALHNRIIGMNVDRQYYTRAQIDLVLEYTFNRPKHSTHYSTSGLPTQAANEQWVAWVKWRHEWANNAVWLQRRMNGDKI